MKYKVGTVCTIVKTNSEFRHLVGRDCTIIFHLENSVYGDDYKIQIQGEVGVFGVIHEHLKPKDDPAKFQEFMRKVMKPVDINHYTGDLV